MPNNQCFLVNHSLRVLILIAKYSPESWTVNPHAMAVMQAVAAEDWNGRWREFDNNNGPEDWGIEYEGRSGYDGYYIFGGKYLDQDIEDFIAAKDKEAGYEPGHWDRAWSEDDAASQKQKYVVLDVKCSTFQEERALIAAVLGKKGRGELNGTAIGADGAEYAYALDCNLNHFGVSGIWLGPPETVPIPWRSAA